MSSVLAGPTLAAAALLCVSAVAKLRRPATASQALALLGLPVPAPVVRGLSAAELGLGLFGVLVAGRVVLGLIAAAYAGFALLTLALRRERAACGCFGESGAPASAAGAALSGALATVCGLAAVTGSHRLGWVLGQPASTAVSLVIGTAGCVFALVVAYTDFPRAWAAWGAP